ncbi:MAG: hypothetical protein PHD57_09970 [Desulfobacterales bacterium]|nr:hypothetical protein [Desulfobacterales bacterium]MDD3950595.1 hypothetical protein [Desulfobacterales bacterium]MDD4463362.1 hypothetical protein [Desulfobacterales bacterium]
MTPKCSISNFFMIEAFSDGFRANEAPQFIRFAVPISFRFFYGIKNMPQADQSEA